MRRTDKLEGRKATNSDWAKHLRPYSKRRANKANRAAAKRSLVKGE